MIGWLRNEDRVYGFLCSGIAGSLIFWPLLNSLFCLAILAYWIFFSKKFFSLKSPKSRWVILFCLLYLVVVVGSLYSYNIKETFFKLQQKSAYLLFPVVFGTSVVSLPLIARKSFRNLTVAIFIACAFCLLKGLYLYAITGSNDSLFGYSLVYSLKDMTPFMMSVCCLVSLLYLFQTIFESKSNSFAFPLLKLHLIIACSIILFLLLVGNRIILFAAFVILIYYCFQIFSHTVSKILFLTGLILLGFVSINLNPFLKNQWNELADLSPQSSIPLDVDSSLGRSWGGKQLRTAIWKCSWDVIKRNWLVGVGTGDVQDSLQAAYEKRKFYFASRYNEYNTHNQYLQETVTSGIVGLSIFLSCLIAPLFIRFEPTKRKFYVLFILCFAFSCLTDTPLELNKGIILYSFFNSLLFFKNY